MPAATDSETLWYRITCDGTDVKALVQKASTQPADASWSDATHKVWQTTGTTGRFDLTGGRFGFRAVGGVPGVDDLTLETDADGDGTWTKEIVERFSVDANNRSTQNLEYDAAGNLTYDGVFRYTYDAWNRQTKVTKAYRDDNGVLQLGSVVQENQYDGVGRRVVVEVKNSGDLDHTEHVFYDGWSQVETRNGSGIVTKQMTWAGRVGGYIDELLQIAHNLDWPDALPAADQTCEAKYWAMQDANYNVLGIVDDEGKLVERYAYTAYGERTVYGSAGGNDPMAATPISTSRHDLLIDGSSGASVLNPYGFTGKPEGESAGGYYFQSRSYNPPLSRFQQRDPKAYVDGANTYAAYFAMRIKLDPTGEALYAFDGTWNHRTIERTNIARFVDRYRGGPRVYMGGIGNRIDYDAPHQQILGGVFGLGGHTRVRDMYEDVVSNYNRGIATDDESFLSIDIIGFSRGGAEAIALANLISDEGIPDTRGGTRLVRERVYRRAPGGRGAGHRFETRVRREPCSRHYPSIRFLGTFDAVASFGIGVINIHGVGAHMPNLGWDFDRSRRIQWWAAIQRPPDGRFGFKSVPVEGADHVWWPPEGTTHWEVGTRDDTLNWMINSARWQHVPMSPL